MNRIAVIEDSVEDQMFIRKCFDDMKSDYKISFFSTVREFENSNKDNYDLAILDLVLPDTKSPSETLSKISAHFNKPMIMLSDLNSTSLVQNLPSLNIKAYLTKEELNGDLLERNLITILNSSKLQVRSTEILKENMKRKYETLIKSGVRENIHLINNHLMVLLNHIEEIENKYEDKSEHNIQLFQELNSSLERIVESVKHIQVFQEKGANTNEPQTSLTNINTLIAAYEEDFAIKLNYNNKLDSENVNIIFSDEKFKQVIDIVFYGLQAFSNNIALNLYSESEIVFFEFILDKPLELNSTKNIEKSIFSLESSESNYLKNILKSYLGDYSFRISEKIWELKLEFKMKINSGN